MRQPTGSAVHEADPGDSARWRLVDGDGGHPAGVAPLDGALNMAIDQALLDSVAAGGAPVLRLYRWSPATLSFGRNQPARGLYDEAAAAQRGIGFVRRPTGGQAVLHDDELTYAVIAPVAVVGKPRSAYRRINEALVAGLTALGLDAAVAGPAKGPGGLDRAGTSWLDACFRHPAEGEIVVAGRKLVGSAQRTESHTILQHGSILVGGTQSGAEELLLQPTPGPRRNEGWTTVEAELGSRPEMEALTAGLVMGFEVTFGITLARTPLTSRERAGAGELRDRFRSREWTWRR